MRVLKADRAYLTTTLYRLRKHRACNFPDGDKPGRYDHLVAALGPGYGDRKRINLLTILEHNGVDDTLWALRTTQQNCDCAARLMAAAFAESVLPAFEASHPHEKRARETIAVARRYARRGKVTDKELRAAWGVTAAHPTSAAPWAARCAASSNNDGPRAARSAAIEVNDGGATDDALGAIVRKYLLEKP
jgi:hypothetical protein